MKNILTLIFILTSLCSLADGLDSTLTMLNKPVSHEVNLHLITVIVKAKIWVLIILLLR